MKPLLTMPVHCSKHRPFLQKAYENVGFYHLLNRQLLADAGGKAESALCLSGFLNFQACSLIVNRETFPRFVVWEFRKIGTSTGMCALRMAGGSRDKTDRFKDFLK